MMTLTTFARQAVCSVSIAAAILLAGCAAMGHVAPRSQLVDPSSLDAGSAIRSTEHATPVTWSEQKWWQIFGDPQLDTLVNQAMAGNPSLRVAATRVRIAEATAGVARAATLPSAKADAEFDRYHFTEHEFIPPPYAGNDYWDNKILAEVGYDLDLWGKDRNTLAAAIDNVHASEAESHAAQLALQTSVVRSYLSLALDYCLLDVAQATLDQQQQILDITRRRLAAGLGTHLEVAQAETPLPQTRAELEHLHELITLTGDQLAALSGEGPGAGENIARPQIKLGLVPALPDAIPARWIGQRPDIVAARWRVEAAAKNVEVSKAAFYPDINIGAFAGVQSLNFAQLLTGDSLLTEFGPAVTLPLFTGGRLRAQLAGNTATYDAAVDSYNAAVVTALQQAADQVVTLRSLDTQLSEITQMLASAQKAYDLALAGYRAGLIEYLSVLNTQARLFDAQRQVQQLNERRLDAHAVLISALGGGGNPADGITAEPGRAR